MSKYPQRYVVYSIETSRDGTRIVRVHKREDGIWMSSAVVIKEIDKRDARIAELEKALADKGVGMDALFRKGE
jgi:hypothetical protein